MLDKRLLRDDPDSVRATLARRGEQFADLLSAFALNDTRRREIQTELDAVRAKRNEISAQIGALMKAGNRAEGEARKAEAQEINTRVGQLESEFEQLDAVEQAVLLSLPNLPAGDIPTGGEDAAVVVKEWGELRRFEFTPFDHVELCQRLQLANFEAGARLSGSGFPVLTGQGAMLQRALINYMLDLHIGRHGYTEVRPPFIVRPHCATGTGNLPKFSDQMYEVRLPRDGVPTSGRRNGEQDEDALTGGQHPSHAPDFYLIPTAEMPVANLYRDLILESPQLPIKLCAYSPCFRTEAGSYGKDARGLTRLHQFEKVELVRIAAPDASWDSHEQMTREAETVLEELALPYRRKLLPSGDMAFASAKTYDLEVYCPAEGEWREVSSISNTTDYQSRRMNLRIRSTGDGARATTDGVRATGKPEHPHLLNASGLALPRLMIALLETYQTAAGTVAVPAVLRNYMPGIQELTPPSGGPPFV
jgi:seryl-tRNA synthetase